MTTLHPRGTLRARFEKPADVDVMFRRLGIGARRCDLGDEGLYLAEEIVAADKWFGGSDPAALGILVLALMIAQRQGSSRLPLDPNLIEGIHDWIARGAHLVEPADVTGTTCTPESTDMAVHD